jgi:hypothetical protein
MNDDKWKEYAARLDETRLRIENAIADDPVGTFFDQDDVDTLLAVRDRLAEQATEIELLRSKFDFSYVFMLLERGALIQIDYEAGLYSNYEEYSARMYAAARELSKYKSPEKEGEW